MSCLQGSWLPENFPNWNQPEDKHWNREGNWMFWHQNQWLSPWAHWAVLWHRLASRTGKCKHRVFPIWLHLLLALPPAGQRLASLRKKCCHSYNTDCKCEQKLGSNLWHSVFIATKAKESHMKSNIQIIEYHVETCTEWASFNFQLSLFWEIFLWKSSVKEHCYSVGEHCLLVNQPEAKWKF